MPKYSTGGSTTSSSGTACELCGTDSSSLTEAEIAGATLNVCDSCAPHDDEADPGETATNGETGGDRQRDVVERDTEEKSPMWDGDTSRWEEQGADYDSDQLPHLASDYEETAKTARQDHGLTVAELAEELGVDERIVFAVESGRAVQEDIGGSVIRGLEEYLNITLQAT